MLFLAGKGQYEEVFIVRYHKSGNSLKRSQLIEKVATLQKVTPLTEKSQSFKKVTILRKSCNL